jgi:EAL domain-containing protein (putative c-di-GMP-specific phosphodiesterase class I)
MDLPAVAPALSFVVDDSCTTHQGLAKELSEQFGIVVASASDGASIPGQSPLPGVFLRTHLSPAGIEALSPRWDSDELLLAEIPFGKGSVAPTVHTIAILDHVGPSLNCRYTKFLSSFRFGSLLADKGKHVDLLDLFTDVARERMRDRLCQVTQEAKPLRLLLLARERVEGSLRPLSFTLEPIEGSKGLFVLELSVEERFGMPSLPVPDGDSPRQRQLLEDLSSALERKETTFFLQPIYDLGLGRFVGAEALVRWNHPSLGLLFPGEFIPLFERKDLIARLDLSVLDGVCAFQASLLERGLVPLPISVNMSPLDFNDPMLGETILSIVGRYGLSPDLVSFEITESAYMEHQSLLVGTLEVLRENGFEILLDDFGSGYSSLELLAEAPISVMKLDMGFTRQIGTSEKVEAALEMLVSLAANLGLGIIAEGVEHEHQQRFYRSVGCSKVQGYLYARPMDRASFVRFLSGR